MSQQLLTLNLAYSEQLFYQLCMDKFDYTTILGNNVWQVYTPFYIFSSSMFKVKPRDKRINKNIVSAKKWYMCVMCLDDAASQSSIPSRYVLPLSGKWDTLLGY